MIQVHCELTPKFWEISVDGEPWMTSTVTLLGKRPRFKKEYPDLASWEEAFYTREEKFAFHYACRCLSKRAYPSCELRKKLKEKKCSEKSLEAVMAKLQRLGLVNDQEWVELFIRSQQGRLYGPARIIQKLRLKGFSRDEAESYLSQMMEGEDSDAQIKRLLETRYRNSDLSDLKTKRRVVQALQRKGYRYDAIMQALQNHRTLNC